MQDFWKSLGTGNKIALATLILTALGVPIAWFSVSGNTITQKINGGNAVNQQGENNTYNDNRTYNIGRTPEEHSLLKNSWAKIILTQRLCKVIWMMQELR